MEAAVGAAIITGGCAVLGAVIAGIASVRVAELNTAASTGAPPPTGWLGLQGSTWKVVAILFATLALAAVGAIIYFSSSGDQQDGAKKETGAQGPTHGPSTSSVGPTTASTAPTESPSPTPEAFAARIQYTDDLGGGCAADTFECRSAFLYTSPRVGGDSAAADRLGEGASITVTCAITDGRRLKNDVGPAYRGPKPPPYTTWLRLDNGTWATAVYTELLNGVRLSDLPKCS
ncbi:hypothetical protein [Streptomyces griseosporeus]|uniref:hypothetical protein n=1 Tax=Streptomyces griseosporeus TaxID=1910 RepID=UPI0036F57B07